MLRRTLLSAAGSERLRDVVEKVPVSRAVVARFVPGRSAQDAVAAARRLVDDGLLVSLDHLGEDTVERAQAESVRDAYLHVLRRLGDDGLARSVEVSLKLSAVGQSLGADGEKVALEHAREVCALAARLGTTVTLDMEDHTTTDSTLSVLGELRVDFPDVGAVLQSYLRRTEGDCHDLAHAGSRVRLCKGAYQEPGSVAYQDRGEVDRSYVRCLKVLMAGQGYPMVATHDPRLVEIAGALAVRHGRAHGAHGDYEYQMLYGIRPDEQRRLAAAGDLVRVYTPYGDEWWGYLVRRLAERPANLAFFLRAVATKG